MSRLTQARRHEVQNRHNKLRDDITSAEERTAVLAVLADTGMMVEKYHGYDKRADKCYGLARDSDGKLQEFVLPGDTVQKVVDLCRMMLNSKGHLQRPSEVIT